MSLASEDDDDGGLFLIIRPNLVMQNDVFEDSDITKKQYQHDPWLIKIINTNSIVRCAFYIEALIKDQYVKLNGPEHKIAVAYITEILNSVKSIAQELHAENIVKIMDYCLAAPGNIAADIAQMKEICKPKLCSDPPIQDADTLQGDADASFSYLAPPPNAPTLLSISEGWVAPLLFHAIGEIMVDVVVVGDCTIS